MPILRIAYHSSFSHASTNLTVLPNLTLSNNMLSTLPLHTHLRDIIPILDQIRPKLSVFLIDSILPNMRQQEKRNESRQDTQCRTHKERILTSFDWIRILVAVVEDSENLIANKSTDFADCSGDTVVLASDGGSTGFRGDQADVVARAEFTEGEEDAVDDYEAGDVGRVGEVAVDACHDETDDSLGEHTDAQSQFGT